MTYSEENLAFNVIVHIHWNTPNVTLSPPCSRCEKLTNHHQIKCIFFGFVFQTKLQHITALIYIYSRHWPQQQSTGIHITNIFSSQHPDKWCSLKCYRFRENVRQRRDQVLRQLGMNICVNQYRVCVLRYGRRTANNINSVAGVKRTQDIVQQNISVLFCTSRTCYFSDRPARDLIWTVDASHHVLSPILIYIRISHNSWPKHTHTQLHTLSRQNANYIEVMANMKLQLLIIWHTVNCLLCPRYDQYLPVKYEDILPDNVHA